MNRTACADLVQATYVFFAFLTGTRYFGGVTVCDHVIWNVAYDYRTGSNDRVVAHRNSVRKARADSDRGTFTNSNEAAGEDARRDAREVF